jgi:hypothetical protein
LRILLSLFCSSDPPGRQDTIKEFLESARIAEKERSYKESYRGKQYYEQRLKEAENAKKNSGNEEKEGDYSTRLQVA